MRKAFLEKIKQERDFYEEKISSIGGNGNPGSFLSGSGGKDLCGGG